MFELILEFIAIVTLEFIAAVLVFVFKIALFVLVVAHEKDVAEFQKQADNGTDADLKKFAAETLPTLKMHLEMIKAISGKIK